MNLMQGGYWESSTSCLILTTLDIFQAACVSQYEHKDLAEFLEGLWASLRREVCFRYSFAVRKQDFEAAFTSPVFPPCISLDVSWKTVKVRTSADLHRYVLWYSSDEPSHK